MAFSHDAHDSRATNVSKAIKVKNRPNTRSDTSKTPLPKPRTKTEEKKRSAERREKQKQKDLKTKRTSYRRPRNPEVSPANMTDEEIEAKARKQAEEIAAAKEAKRASEIASRNALTDKEKEQREKCLEAKEQAVLPTRKEMREMFAYEYERRCLTKRVDVMGMFGTTSELTERDFEYMFYHGVDAGISYLPTKQFFAQVLEEWIFQHNRDLKLRRSYRYDENKSKTKRISQVIADEMLADRTKVRRMRANLAKDFPFSRFVSFVAQNPKYRFVRAYANAIEAVCDYKSKTYSAPDFERHFILDIGPTNSGKTYSGMQRLMAAKSGVYLGPLRLLAMEAAETMNENGVPCSMLTGEEANILDEATHIASTVEMLDKEARYEVAVIDECQMIADPERGYAWSAAIASVNAKTVHLCLAPEAEDIITRILDGLDEEYEINYHDRLVPLEMTKAINYPKGIQKGDALVVFSRKQVQARAAELEKKGFKTSIVYGALPYDVRKEEVRKFMDGETDVVVATDAIGMGLNLPVKRMVFAESEKYDGHTTRELTINEIKQIAGRAGRFGKFDVGYVTGITKEITDIVATALATETPQIDEIRLDMPRQVTTLDLPLCMLMRAWQLEELDYPYIKRNLAPQIELAKRVSDLPNLFVSEAVDIPFKSGDRFVPLDDMWEKGVRQAFTGKKPDVELYEVDKSDTLQHLEDAAKVADLAYGLMKRYGDEGDLERVDEERRLISQLMIMRLNDDKSVKRCTWCGRIMNDNTKHKMHDGCYREWRAQKYGYGGYREDYGDGDLDDYC